MRRGRTLLLLGGGLLTALAAGCGTEPGARPPDPAGPARVIIDNFTFDPPELTVPVALEVIAALFDWPDDELAEPEFLAALLDRTDALLLLDVANVYANAVNRGHDPRAMLDRILDLVPADRIGYVHVAGGGVRHDEAGLPGGELYHDTHTDPVPDAVLGLLAHLVERAPGVPVLLERDGRYPPAAVLTAELAAVAQVAHP